MFPDMTEDDAAQQDDRASRSGSRWPRSATPSSRSRRRTAAGPTSRTARTTAASHGGTEMLRLRPGRRPRAAEDHGRSDRHQGARHRLQLRRRRHALGHDPDLRGGPVRHLRRRSVKAARDCRAAASATAMTARTITAAAGSRRRFRLDKEPNEPNRFDWVVEIDPYDPASAPVKRTALGRISHEGATIVVNKDGRVVVYHGRRRLFRIHLPLRLGQGRSIPRTAPPTGPARRGRRCRSPRFDDDGTLVWLPLVHGEGQLTAENGFRDQGEVLVKTRLAADRVGATRMDRPEGFEANPVTGRVYAVMTKNAKREPGDELNPANPRAKNAWGHILELIPPGDGQGRRPRRRRLPVGHPAPRRRSCRPGAWAPSSIPARARTAGWSPPTTSPSIPRAAHGSATDGANDFDLADGVYACDTEGEGRALTRAVLRLPVGGRGHRRLLHAGRQDPVRLGPASGRGLRDPGQADHPLAGFRRQACRRGLPSWRSPTRTGCEIGA